MNLKDLEGVVSEKEISQYRFSKKSVSPSGESKEYYLSQAKSVYFHNLLSTGSGYISMNRRAEFVQNRLIATGRNSLQGLIGKIKGNWEKEDKKVNLQNLDWESLKLVSKFRDIIIDKIEENDFDFILTAINPEAGAEKEKMKWDIWAQAQQMEWVKMMEGIAGVQLMQPKETQIPIKTKRDLDLYMEMEYKPAYEVSAELGVQHVCNDNKWDMIKKLLVEDAIDLARICVDVCQSPVDGRVEIKYVDIVNAILPEFRGHYMENPEICGYLYTITIAQLAAQNPDIDEMQMQSLARKYSSKFGNPVWTQVGNTPIYNTDSSYTALLAYNIPVMKFYFEASDALKCETKMRETDVKVQWTTPDAKVGEQKYNERKKTVGRPYLATKKVEQVDAHFYHQCHWVIGTEIVFNYGKVPNQSRNISKSKLAECPMKYYIIDHVSLIDRMRVWQEAADLAWLKMQAAKAAAVPSGYSVDISALANLTVDGKDMTYDKAIKIYESSGKLIWSSRNFLTPDNMNGYTPIRELANGLGKDYAEWINDLEYNYNKMRELVGLNQATDASNQSDRTLTGVAKLSVRATQSSLSQIMGGVIFISERMAEEIIQKLQILVKYGDVRVLVQSIGGVAVKFIGSEITPHTYGCKLEARPTLDQRAELKEAAKSALINTADPVKGGLNYDDYFYICNLIDSDTNFKLVQMIFGYMVRKNLERQSAMAQQNAAAQTDGQRALQQEGFQIEMAKMDKQLQNDITFLHEEASIQGNVLNGKAQEKMAINQQKSELKKDEKTHDAIINSVSSD